MTLRALAAKVRRPRYRWTDTGMHLDPKGAYVLAHMVPDLNEAGRTVPANGYSFAEFKADALTILEAGSARLCRPRGHRYDRVGISDVLRCRRCGWERAG